VSSQPYAQASIFFFKLQKILSFNLKRKSNIFFWGKISFQEAAGGTPAFLSAAVVRARRTKRGNHGSEVRATPARGAPTTGQRLPLLV